MQGAGLLSEGGGQGERLGAGVRFTEAAVWVEAGKRQVGGS